MHTNYNKVKEKLSEEFEWLKNNYPLPLFSMIELHVYQAENYNALYKEEHTDQYEQKEIDAFLLEQLNESNLEHAIFIIASEQHELDEVDKMVVEKGNMKEEHLYYFMLYHEYGHLVHLHDSYKEKGLEGYLSEKEEMEMELHHFIMSKEKKNLTEQEFQVHYRALWFEKMADDFAYQVYEKRKETLE